jgi:hypothetical protein
MSDATRLLRVILALARAALLAGAGGGGRVGADAGVLHGRRRGRPGRAARLDQIDLEGEHL